MVYIHLNDIKFKFSMNTKKFTILLLVLTCLFSCKNKYDLSTSEIELLTNEVNEMYERDQGIRNELTKLDSFYGVDRKTNGYFLSTKDKKDLLKEEYAEYNYKRDSIWEAIHPIDDANTKQLISLTKKYGFPSRERLKVKKAKAYFILVHSDRQYFDEIRSLIEQEYEAKRISEYERAYIFWHLDGRQGMMPSLGENGKVTY